RRMLPVPPALTDEVDESAVPHKYRAHGLFSALFPHRIVQRECWLTANAQRGSTRDPVNARHAPGEVHRLTRKEVDVAKRDRFPDDHHEGAHEGASPFNVVLSLVGVVVEFGRNHGAKRTLLGGHYAREAKTGEAAGPGFRVARVARSAAAAAE